MESIHIFMSVPEAQQQNFMFGSLCKINKSCCGMESCAFWYFYFKVYTEMLGRLFRWEGETRNCLRRQPSSESSFVHPPIFRHRELWTGQEKWISLTRSCSNWLKSKRKMQLQDNKVDWDFCGTNSHETVCFVRDHG